MAKNQLTDKQRVILSAAARSCNLNVLPLPRKLKLSPGTTGIVIRGLLQKGVIEKRVAMGADTVWKEEDGKNYTLVVTKRGLDACGMNPADERGENAGNAAQSRPTTAVSDQERRMPRPGSKLATLVALLEREGGATIEEMAAATGWQTHTVRGVMSGALATKFGLRIVSEKVEGRGRVYRIKDAMEADADEVNGARE